MKKFVRICGAENVKSHFGIVIDYSKGILLIKVPCKEDQMDCLETPHCMILGSDFVKSI